MKARSDGSWECEEWIYPPADAVEGMEPPEDTGPEASGPQLKLVRLIDEYGMEGIGAELEQRWTADDEARASLRDLAADFNQQLLAAAMAEADMQPLDGEIENIYRLLTGDDVSEGERTRTRRRLEREGVDVERLLDDFVTYQAIRTYLTKHREAEYAGPDRDPTEGGTEHIQRLRGRTATVTESKLEQLRDTDDLVLGAFRTLVDITILCEDCGGQYEVGDLLERGGCDCAERT